MGGKNAFLAFDADLVKQDVPRVTQQLVISHGGVDADQ
jgi:hypothetical protein